MNILKRIALAFLSRHFGLSVRSMVCGNKWKFTCKTCGAKTDGFNRRKVWKASLNHLCLGKKQ